MLGRYTLTTDQRTLEGLPWVERSWVRHRPRYNVAPGQRAPVLCRTRMGGGVIRSLRWGLVPSWADEPNIGFKLLSAPGEDLDTEPAFQYAYRYHRCVVLADGFYHLDHDDPEERRMYWFHRPERRLLPMMGIWEEWVTRSGMGRILYSYAVVTVPSPPGGPVGLPARMPGVLSDDDVDAWLDHGTPHEELEDLMKRDVTTDFRKRRVSDLVVRREAEGPRCIESIPEPAEEPPSKAV